ncbi:MAG: hypothetical protein CMP23_04070 [Rickettsiales bacterium]|nr:hypothetical protein [Rickettsiales bacterium]|tara:strand:+ start:12 stop:248 length:237 start_codon:yes stop_codon:yes gene_type:complete
MSDTVSFAEISEILDILDEHYLNRERIEIPLGRQDPGGIEALAEDRIRVTVPSSRDFDGWLEEIGPQILAALGVSEDE